MRDWVHGLFDLDAAKGQTVRCQRTVPVVVNSHDDIDEYRTELHYPGRFPWV